MSQHRDPSRRLAAVAAPTSTPQASHPQTQQPMHLSAHSHMQPHSQQWQFSPPQQQHSQHPQSQQPQQPQQPQQSQQSQQWQFSPQQAITARGCRASQPIQPSWHQSQLSPQQQVQQQGYLQMPMMPQRAYSQMRQPSGDYTQWPQHLTAKQALGLQQRPALPSFQPPQIMLQQGPQQEFLSSAQVVGNGQKQQDGGDSLESLTKTQEIFVYQKSPSTSPKGHQESTPDACDEVSFADQGSVVIHGGNAALPNIQNITTEVLSSRERFSSPPAKDHRTEKEIAECLANAAEERNLEAVCEAMRRAHLAGMNPELMLQGLADAVNRTHLGGGGDGHIEVFDAADVKAEAPTSGFASRDEPTSGSATPASTIGIVGEVREDLIKLMRMPTRPLDDDPAASPIHTTGHATPTNASQGDLSASQAYHSMNIS